VVRCLLGAAMPLAAAAAQAQDIEPRSFSNAPVGVNFLIAGYAYTRGGVSFDPSVPLADAHLETSSAVVAYSRVLDLWGMSSRIDALLPYTWLSGSATFAPLTLSMLSRQYTCICRASIFLRMASMTCQSS